MHTLARYWRQKVIALITLSAMLISHYAFSAPLALDSLTLLSANNEVVNNDAITKKEDNVVSVTMIFQPDCSWCKKQGKTLAKAFEQCQSSVAIALVGTKGNTRQLKKELKHYHDNIPAYEANRRFLRTIGGYQASPTTLIYDHQGNLIAKKRGFIPEEKLAQAFNVLTKGQCQI